MKAYEQLELTTYMNRENYLKDFKTRHDVLLELDYISYRLTMKIDKLTRAVLELKQIDLNNILKGELNGKEVL